MVRSIFLASSSRLAALCCGSCSHTIKHAHTSSHIAENIPSSMDTPALTQLRTQVSSLKSMDPELPACEWLTRLLI
jgi:hypothetical protein